MDATSPPYILTEAMSGKKELYLLFNFTYVKCLLYNLFKFHLKAQHTTTQMWQINIGLDAGILGISIGQKYLAAQKTVNKLGNLKGAQRTI